jgi:hypothetical protein
LEVVRDVSYNAWRTFDPEATLRFHALRLYDVGMIKSTPQRLIAAGTDWRFLNELKRELRLKHSVDEEQANCADRCVQAIDAQLRMHLTGYSGLRPLPPAGDARRSASNHPRTRSEYP